MVLWYTFLCRTYFRKEGVYLSNGMKPVDHVRQLVEQEQEAKQKDYARKVIAACFSDIEQVERLEEEWWAGFNLPAFEVLEYMVPETLSFIESTRRDLAAYLFGEEDEKLQAAQKKLKELTSSL